MAVDRNLWESTFSETEPPHWLCPTCGVGSLSWLPASFHRIETLASREARGESAWEPAWITERFAGLLQCARKECEDVIAVGGKTEVEEDHVPDPSDLTGGRVFLVHRLRPSYVSPAPLMFRLPDECPSLVKAEILNAFALFWTDYGAAANKLRSALEKLMTHFKVKRFAIDTKKHRRIRIDLHNRIELMRSKFPAVADHLLAAKWIGNSGVHSAKITASDVYDAMDLVEYALDELIAKRTKTLEQMTKAINTRKGPRPTR